MKTNAYNAVTAIKIMTMKVCFFMIRSIKKYEVPFNYILNIFFLISILFLGGCDIIYRYLDKEGAEEKELVGEVMLYETNPTIEEIQYLLDIYGYSVGKPDGILGTQTRNAVEKFQRDNGIEPSRFVDKETWAKLIIFKQNGFIEQNKLSIKQVQLALNYAGYEAGKVDGKMGPKTKEAIVEFQKGNGLEADGKVGYKTLEALNFYIK